MATKKTPTKKAQSPETQAQDFTITLTLGDRVYTATASDPTEAILSIKPIKVVTKGVFKLSHNGRQAELLKQVGMTRRFLSNRMAAFILGRNLQTLLK